MFQNILYDDINSNFLHVKQNRLFKTVIIHSYMQLVALIAPITQHGNAFSYDACIKTYILYIYTLCF